MNLTDNRQQNILRRSMAALICLWLVCGVVFSVFFVSNEYDHDCSGDECPICQIITVCENFVKNISGGLILAVAALAAVLVVAGACVKDSADIIADTLITQKVRLNN